MDAAAVEGGQQLHEFVLAQFSRALVCKPALIQQRQDLALEVLTVLVLARPGGCLGRGITAIDTHVRIIGANLIATVMHWYRCKRRHVSAVVHTFEQTLQTSSIETTSTSWVDTECLANASTDDCLPNWDSVHLLNAAASRHRV